MDHNTNARYPDDDDVTVPASDLDELAGQLIDEGASESEFEEAVSAGQRERLVDLQWLDAMLEQSQKPADATKAAIQSVLSRLREEVASNGAMDVPTSLIVTPTSSDSIAVSTSNVPLAPQRRLASRSQRRWWSSLAVVATLATFLILWWPWQRQSADAMFERAMKAAAIDSYDRVYDVLITRRDSPDEPRQAELTVRGGKKFVFEQTRPFGGKLVIGGNGQEVWLVPVLGPVVVGGTDSVLPEWTKRVGADMPFLQITAALKRMRAQYEITHLPAEEIPHHKGTFHHFVGHRQFRYWAPFGFAPAQIDLWADPESGVVHRLILQWTADAKGLVPEKVELNLTDKKPSSEKVYDYSYYAEGRRVQDLRSSK